MCKCTPEIRTPFCGKPGCEPPEDHRDDMIKEELGLSYGARGPVIVWLDYGMDGWGPFSFGSTDEAVAWLSSGATGRRPFVITRAMRLVALDG